MSLRAMGIMVADLARGRYPGVIYGRSLRERELPPVFCLHEADPEPFEALLVYLAENKYRTLSCDEYLDMQQGRRPVHDRTILLTFDDGHRRLWTIIYPLLKKYGQRGTAFVIPGRVRHDQPDDHLPTLTDVWAGRATREEVCVGWAGARPLCSWEQLQEMADSGTVEIQCHSLGHHRVFTSDRVVDFVNPALLARTHPNRLTMWSQGISDTGAAYEPPPLGAPVYTSAPRLTGSAHLPADRGVYEACVARVEREGGEAFFRSPHWRRCLRQVVRRSFASHRDAARYQTPAEVEQQIRADLTTAKAMIESKLRGVRVRHLAFPWGIGSELAVQIAAEAGYVGCFWGRVGARVKNLVGGSPLHLARMGEDFIPLLQGRNRKRIPRLFLTKLARYRRRR